MIFKLIRQHKAGLLQTLKWINTKKKKRKTEQKRKKKKEKIKQRDKKMIDGSTRQKYDE